MQVGNTGVSYFEDLQNGGKNERLFISKKDMDKAYIMDVSDITNVKSRQYEMPKKVMTQFNLMTQILKYDK